MNTERVRVITRKLGFKTQAHFPSTFRNGRMNYQIWNGLTAAILTTAVGVASSNAAKPNQEVNPDSQVNLPASVQLNKAVEVAQALTPTFISAPSQLQINDVTKLGEYQSPRSTEVAPEVIAKINTHKLGKSQAATLYVRSIPVLTFLGSPITHQETKLGQIAGNQSSSINNLSRSQSDPVWQATAIAAKLNQLNRNNINANNINVSWKANCNCYAINVADQELVEVNSKTILPDTTRNLATDALQATNRLRRLIGNAPPLRLIANLPTPKFPKISLPQVNFQIRGIASWYGAEFHGSRSASGEIFNHNAMTAAHRTLPFGTKVRVTNLKNGRSVVVRINDRGPFIRGRVIDVSTGAAKMLGMLSTGTAPVQIDVLGKSQSIAFDTN